MQADLKVNNKDTDIRYSDLVKKMWYESTPQKPLDIEINASVTDSHTMSSVIYKKRIDPRWQKIRDRLHDEVWDYTEDDERWDNFLLSLLSEYFYIHYVEEDNTLNISTNHVELVTVDKRAFYILVSEVAKAVQSPISEDKKKTWITLEEYQKEHQDILQLSYDEANDLSLEEIDHMKVIDED